VSSDVQLNKGFTKNIRKMTILVFIRILFFLRVARFAKEALYFCFSKSYVYVVQ